MTLAAEELVKDCDFLYNPQEYLIRNHIIVDLSTVIIATPYNPTRSIRGGTWSTINYAEKMKRDTRILYRGDM